MKGGMQADNYDPIREAFSNVAVVSPQKTLYLWDLTHSIGGPIKKDRLWFFYTTSYLGSGSSLPGMYYNKNAGDITKWLYEPTLSGLPRTAIRPVPSGRRCV